MLTNKDNQFLDKELQNLDRAWRKQLYLAYKL